MFYVYCIQNVTNKKIYVGFTVNYEKRWSEEIRAAFNKNCKDYEKILSRAFRKYAKNQKEVKDFFTFQVLEEFIYSSEALEAEQFWIEYFRSNIHQFGAQSGYNCTIGGDTTFGFRHSEESKQKISEKQTGKYIGENNPFFGKKHTEETKQKLRDTWAKSKALGARTPHNKGVPMTAEHRELLNKACSEKLSGEGNGRAKLNWDQVNEIREKYKNGIRCKNLSEEYKVTITNILSIVKHETWKIK